MKVDTKDLCNSQFIADYCGVTIQAVRNWRLRGVIKSVAWKGNPPLFHWPTARAALVKRGMVGNKKVKA